MSPSGQGRRRVPAIKVHQWLPQWNEVKFDRSQFRAEPPEHFYLFSLGAAEARALSGIFRRTTARGTARARDLGIQRRHEEERSEEIREFVRHGFPWSALNRQRKESGDFNDLKKPGWLPTSIVVNILKSDDSREGQVVHNNDALVVETGTEGLTHVILPQQFDQSWKPRNLAPIEVIDGQHRLWAFDDWTEDGFELPIVAFHGLDISWQAYLFYTINIKPKKINTSLAFDLYPLLRTEQWLERFEGHSVYRETRAQEITEALWSFNQSPWHHRINMLGERGHNEVTQAAWIRSLLATFVKSFRSRRVQIGGLFGAPIGSHQTALGWSRPQQAGFIILLWQEVASAVTQTKAGWAKDLRETDAETTDKGDAAFQGRFSLLNTDQGVRGVLAIANDLCWVEADKLDLYAFTSEDASVGTSDKAIANSIKAFGSAPVGRLLTTLATSLASYDWRTSAASSLSDDERSDKARFRGGTGYRELRKDLLGHLARGRGETSALAKRVLALLSL